MKFLFLQLIAIFGLASVLLAEDLTIISLTSDQAADVRHQLEAFEKGNVTLDEITVDRDEDWSHKLIAYYYTHTNTVNTKMKLPVSRCLGGFGKYSEALQLAQEYVSVYSNDWHGWRIIGTANMQLQNFSAALNAYTNAVRDGDVGNYPALGLAALKTDRLDIVQDFVPRLLHLKNSKSREALQAATVLVIYSLRTEQKDLFVKAVKGLDPKDILAHDDVTFLVKQGLEQFKGEDIDKIRQELEAVTGSGSSSTNNPSP
jgi:tetratricopeptide (TPR) repeat protein